MTPNQRAFLSMIGVSEGTSSSPATKNKGHEVIVTGVDGLKGIFLDYAEIVVSQLGKLDLASASGKLLLTMLAALAEVESDLLEECL